MITNPKMMLMKMLLSSRKRKSSPEKTRKNLRES
jgi:hypothetical protein